MPSAAEVLAQMQHGNGGGGDGALPDPAEDPLYYQKPDDRPDADGNDSEESDSRLSQVSHDSEGGEEDEHSPDAECHHGHGVQAASDSRRPGDRDSRSPQGGHDARSPQTQDGSGIRPSGQSTFPAKDTKQPLR